jgi:hypothetical protein
VTPSWQTPSRRFTCGRSGTIVIVSPNTRARCATHRVERSTSDITRLRCDARFFRRLVVKQRSSRHDRRVTTATDHSAFPPERRSFRAHCPLHIFGPRSQTMDAASARAARHGDRASGTSSQDPPLERSVARRCSTSAGRDDGRYEIVLFGARRLIIEDSRSERLYRPARRAFDEAFDARARVFRWQGARRLDRTHAPARYAPARTN